jgi:hypothetical protein
MELNGDTSSTLNLADRQMEKVDSENGEKAEGIDTEATSNHEGQKERLSRISVVLTLERKHQNKGGMDKEQQDSPMPNSNDVIGDLRSADKKQEEMKNKNQQHCDSAEEI